MAPPQVNLSQKKPQDGWVDPMVVDAPLPPIKTADLQLQMPVPGVVLARRCNKRRQRIVIGVVAVVFLLAGLAVTAAFLFKRFGHNRNRFDGDVEHSGFRAMELYRVDPERQLINVSRDAAGLHFAERTSSVPRDVDELPFSKMQTILDFNMGYAGYKDFGSQRCYIEMMTETFEEAVDRLYTNQGRCRRPRELRLVDPQNPISPVGFSLNYGLPIAKLCKDVPAYNAEEVPLDLQDLQDNPDHGGRPDHDDSDEMPPLPSATGGHILV